MKLSVLFFGVLVAGVFGFPTERKVRDSRVVGGEDAYLGEIPYQASISWYGVFHFCGGSIITARTILTAAHCIDGEAPSAVQAIVGKIHISTGGTSYQSTSLIMHPNYDANSITNDIGLLITVNTIVTSSTVSIIPIETQHIGGGVAALLSGWGQTSHPGHAADILQKLTVYTLSNAHCGAVLGGIIDSSICTFTRVDEGACFGDSGGPLVADGRVLGIVSWGYPCAIGYPDVFARVSSFTSWITANSQG